MKCIALSPQQNYNLHWKMGEYKTLLPWYRRSSRQVGTNG